MSLPLAYISIFRRSGFSRNLVRKVTQIIRRRSPLYHRLQKRFQRLGLLRRHHIAEYLRLHSFHIASGGAVNTFHKDGRHHLSVVFYGVRNHAHQHGRCEGVPLSDGRLHGQLVRRIGVQGEFASVIRQLHRNILVKSHLVRRLAEKILVDQIDRHIGKRAVAGICHGILKALLAVDFVSGTVYGVAVALVTSGTGITEIIKGSVLSVVSQSRHNLES